MSFRVLRPTVRLAVPIALSQIGLMVMVLVDTWFVGRLGPAALAGAGLGSALFYGFTLFGSGTLLALDYFVANAYGRRDLPACNRWLVQGCVLAVLLSVPLVAGNWIAAACLGPFGIEPEIAEPARRFLVALGWSLPPFLLFICFRQYLAAMSSVRATTLILIVANVANALLNVWLVPWLGVTGSGLATTGTRVVMLAAIVVFAFRRDAREGWGLRAVPWEWDPAALRTLWRIGLPSGLQMLVRSAVFSVATTLVARLGALPLAAHAIVMNLASFVYMLPVGIGAAASVVVGQSLGRGEREEARAAGSIAIALGGITMALVGIVLAGGGESLVSCFTDDAAVIALGGKLMLAVAAFQIADALQTIAVGALRGGGDTRAALVANGIGHWAVGLPLGALLCFGAGWGVLGVWIGLTTGLCVAAAIVLPRWVRFRSLVAHGQ